MSSIDTNTSVGELVVQRPSRSRIFQRLGIDFCCGGKKSLADACAGRGLDAASVLRVLEASEDSPTTGGVDVAGMGLGELCDHIETTHHAFLLGELPRLHAMITKVAAVHGDRYPWMRDVLAVYRDLMNEMLEHMGKEERVLFPAIRALESGGTPEAVPCGGTIARPIGVMESEHESAGAALAKIRELTSQFTPPMDACNTFRAALDGLRELEADMHQHVHKENNVLFPRALRLGSAGRVVEMK